MHSERTQSADGAFDPFRLQTQQERQERLLTFFRAIGLPSLKGLKILDVGCGSGGQLRRLTDFGADPSQCFGIDLSGKDVGDARRVNPNISFAHANAAELPFKEDSFDLVFQFTVLTSVLESDTRRQIVNEIQRVLRSGGYFISYDFAYSNPSNSNVRGIPRRELAGLLDPCVLRFSRLTLAPPIGRPVAKLSPFLYRTLAAIPLLRTHYFCFAQKP
jgi:ubiquinone/menaquinone biosynthesis C-methylase UbiE